ncbi:MAG: polymerase delta prime subunit protein [Pseudomonadota bacterium]
MSEDRPGILDGAIAPADNLRLFGHDAAQDFLAQAYRSGKSHHAILIEGPEGIGKATLAFRFANHVLAHPDPHQAPDHVTDPDPQSPIFRQISSGASHHLLYLSRPVDDKTGKVKSAIPVDEIRKAGKFFSQTSGTGNWRIVIVDPADDLNRNAANAILKILEEPPKRAMFLVLSHAPGKLLPTIRSRCQTLSLAPLSDADMLSCFENLSLTINPQMLPTILKAAKGSVSEALKLVHYGGLEIMEVFTAVLETAGPKSRQSMHKLADAMAAKDNETLYTFFRSQITSEIEIRAKQAALNGNLVGAERLARLASDVTERLTIADAYNLDRKQTVISVLGEFKDAL